MQSVNHGPSDEELVHRVLRRGDEDAFRALYQRHTPRLLRIARNLIPSHDPDPSDLVQETWIRAAGTLACFEWRSRFFTWLTGILVNLVREAHRKSRKADLVELTDAISEWPPPPESGSLIDLERAIGQLSPGARTVIVLHDIHGYTHEEIGDFLGIAVGTSKSQLCRARRTVVGLLNSERRPIDHART